MGSVLVPLALALSVAVIKLATLVCLILYVRAT
jgi:hypothetical protein